VADLGSFPLDDAMTRRRATKIACGVFAALVAVGVLMPITVGTCAPKTCTLCRAERIDRTMLGYLWQSYRDTEFTEWYRAHRPAHEHKWGRLTCTRGFSVFGTTTYFGCGPRHPICDIPPATLREFAEGSDTNTLAAFFDGIVSTNHETQRETVQLVWDRMLESK
jgi:hypothetical protein